MKLDIHCYVGHWPFRHNPYRTVGAIRQLMARTGTWGALVTPMAGIFYKDCLAAVQELCDDLAADAGPGLWPVAVVNPAFPGWREDLAVMVDELGCVAVRLFPNYHHYRLTDPAAEALLAVLEEQALPVMIAPRIEDERLHHWLMRVPAISHLDLAWVLRRFPALKIVLCNMRPDEVDQLLDPIITHPLACVDTSARLPQFHLEALIQQVGVDRVLYGTGMPLQYPECAGQMLEDAAIASDDRQRIYAANAGRLFGITVPEGTGA